MPHLYTKGDPSVSLTKTQSSCPLQRPINKLKVEMRYDAAGFKIKTATIWGHKCPYSPFWREKSDGTSFDC